MSSSYRTFGEIGGSISELFLISGHGVKKGDDTISQESIHVATGEPE